ncbi:MAG: hypothetical protein U5N86_07165 [Planctomycetota bacterium]|nr:hypothetical protein [Planctomycetota bacterium]
MNKETIPNPFDDDRQPGQTDAELRPEQVVEREQPATDGPDLPPPVTVVCPKCSFPQTVTRAGMYHCSKGSCDCEFFVNILTPPRNLNRRPVKATDGAARCVNHPNNASSAVCSRCGVFMCALCETTSEGGKYCPDCFEILRKEKQTRRSSRISWSGVSVHITFFSFVIPFLGIIGLLFSLYGFWGNKRHGTGHGNLTLGICAMLNAITTVGWFLLLTSDIFKEAMQ